MPQQSYNTETRRRRICILGSTGSIGTQALDVIRQHPDIFEAHTLTANTNSKLLIQQAREFLPDSVVIAAEDKYLEVRNALSDLPIKVYTGDEALCHVVQSAEVDMVLAAMVGFAGLRPTIEALKAGKALALANKETLVVAGEIITRIALENRAPILPVDSEHSAIFQSLAGASPNAISRILLTASGGPFRTYSEEKLCKATSREALKHPNWQMGEKITIDSATLMNKGFEVIEAKWLFGVDVNKIEVVVHPESIIHSAVEYADGAIIAQLGVPDMRLPIQYAFAYPTRLPLKGERLDLFKIGTLHFEKVDDNKFPCLQLAYQAIRKGGNMPCILNAANEVANLAFRNDRISFTRIPQILEYAMQNATFIASPTLEDYFLTDKQARMLAESFIA